MITVEPELRQLIVGCKSDPERKQVVAAYLREAKGTDKLTDRVLLARKRKETGAKVSVRNCPLVFYGRPTPSLI